MCASDEQTFFRSVRSLCTKSISHRFKIRSFRKWPVRAPDMPSPNCLIRKWMGKVFIRFAAVAVIAHVLERQSFITHRHKSLRFHRVLRAASNSLKALLTCLCAQSLNTGERAATPKWRIRMYYVVCTFYVARTRWQRDGGRRKS